MSAAMLHPTGLGEFAARFPDRVFDVGIAEQHALTSAAGLTLGGSHPVVALYATFASRTCKPTVIRYPKATTGPDIPAVGRVGHCDILRDDPAAVGLLIGVGALAGPCLAAADELTTHGVPVTVVDPRWIAPVDTALLKLAGAHRLMLSVEDTTTTGALGARIAQALAAAGSDTCAATFALPPRFMPHASRDQILHAHGLDATGIATAILKRLASTHRGKATAKESW